MTIEVNGKQIEVDEEGYLSDLSQWEKDIAEVMAKEDGIKLEEDHWETKLANSQDYLNQQAVFSINN